MTTEGVDITWTVSFKQSFLFIDLERKKNGMGKKWGYSWKFDNVETQNKHEVSLGPCLFKMNLSFSKIGLNPWLGFYHGDFL